MELCSYVTTFVVLCNVFSNPSILASTISTVEPDATNVTSSNISTTDQINNTPETILGTTTLLPTAPESTSTVSDDSSTKSMTSLMASKETSEETSSPASLKISVSPDSSTAVTSLNVTSEANDTNSSSETSLSTKSIQNKETTAEASDEPQTTESLTSTIQSTSNTTTVQRTTKSFTTTDSHVTTLMSTTGSESTTTDSSTSGSKSSTKGATNTTCSNKESMFGTKGAPFIFGAIGICVLLVIVIIVMAVKGLRTTKHHQINDEDQGTPKLKMLEIKDEKAQRSNNDDLQTFSLDYEKHVQDKIDEHKRMKAPPVAPKPTTGVSTFKQKKKQSLKSTSSASSHDSHPSSPLTPVLSVSPSSPGPPGSPAELKPLIKQPDDETMIFNFTKKPSNLLTERRTSAFDEVSRRRSNASGGKTPKLAAQDDSLYV